MKMMSYSRRDATVTCATALSWRRDSSNLFKFPQSMTLQSGSTGITSPALINAAINISAYPIIKLAIQRHAIFNYEGSTRCSTSHLPSTILVVTTKITLEPYKPTEHFQTGTPGSVAAARLTWHNGSTHSRVLDGPALHHQLAQMSVEGSKPYIRWTATSNEAETYVLGQNVIFIEDDHQTLKW